MATETWAPEESTRVRLNRNSNFETTSLKWQHWCKEIRDKRLIGEVIEYDKTEDQWDSGWHWRVSFPGYPTGWYAIDELEPA